MEKKIKKLEQDLALTKGHLDFTCGQLAATVDLMAAFIAFSPDAHAFLEGAADELLEKHKSLSRNRLLAGAYRDGFGAAVDAVVQRAKAANAGS